MRLRDDDEAFQMEESYEIPLYESLHGSHSSRHGHVDVSHGPGDTSSRHFSEPHQRHNHPRDNRTCSSYTLSQNGDRHHAKENYIYAAEPYISAKETFISAREHDASNAESEFAHDSALVRKLEAAQSGENLILVQTKKKLGCEISIMRMIVRSYKNSRRLKKVRIFCCFFSKLVQINFFWL